MIFTWVLFFSFLLYTVSQVLRGLRFWLLYGDSQLTLRTTTAVQQITSSLSHLSHNGIGFGFLSEFLKIFIFSKISNGNWIRVILVSLFCRLFDLIAVSIPLFFFSVYDQDIKNFLIAFSSLACLFILLITTSHKVLNLIKHTLIIKWKFKSVTAIIHLIDYVQRTIQSLTRQGGMILLFNIVLTLFIWLLDVAALFVLMDNSSSLGRFGETYFRWVIRSFEQFIPFQTTAHLDIKALETSIVYPQYALSLLILIFIILFNATKATTKRSEKT